MCYASGSWRALYPSHWILHWVYFLSLHNTILHTVESSMYQIELHGKLFEIFSCFCAITCGNDVVSRSDDELITPDNKKFRQKCQPTHLEEFFPLIPNLQSVLVHHVRFKSFLRC